MQSEDMIPASKAHLTMPVFCIPIHIGVGAGPKGLPSLLFEMGLHF